MPNYCGDVGVGVKPASVCALVCNGLLDWERRKLNRTACRNELSKG